MRSMTLPKREQRLGYANRLLDTAGLFCRRSLDFLESMTISPDRSTRTI